MNLVPLRFRDVGDTEIMLAMWMIRIEAPLGELQFPELMGMLTVRHAAAARLTRPSAIPKHLLIGN